jgi:hypothetical protein
VYRQDSLHVKMPVGMQVELFRIIVEMFNHVLRQRTAPKSVFQRKWSVHLNVD